MVGPSGSGKSTLLHVVAGLDRLDDGAIEVAGAPVHRLGERALTRLRRDKIGLVFQSFHLVPELTGGENVVLPARANGGGAAGATRARALISGWGWATRPRAARPSCPEASSSGSRSPARWSTSPRWCSPTSRPGTSTTRPAPPCSAAARDRRRGPGGSARHPRPACRRRRGPDAAAMEGRLGPRDGMRRAPGLAVARLRARPGRTAVAAAGILAAGAMAGAAITVCLGLATGFDRAADRADLPDVIARFDNTRSPGFVERRVGALPGVATRSYRLEITNVRLSGNGQRTRQGSIEVLVAGRAGATRSWPAATCATSVAGRSSSSAGWPTGSSSRSGTSWTSADSPARGRDRGRARQRRLPARPHGARVRALGPARGRFGRAPVNVASLWLRDPKPRRGARAGAGGELRAARPALRDARRRAGPARPGRGPHRGLLAAFALVTLGAAALMLAASASAEVQRRLRTLGLQRALGFRADR